MEANQLPRLVRDWASALRRAALRRVSIASRRCQTDPLGTMSNVVKTRIFASVAGSLREVPNRLVQGRVDIQQRVSCTPGDLRIINEGGAGHAGARERGPHSELP